VRAAVDKLKGDGAESDDNTAAEGQDADSAGTQDAPF
jgi:hypothetical protein